MNFLWTIEHFLVQRKEDFVIDDKEGTISFVLICVNSIFFNSLITGVKLLIKSFGALNTINVSRLPLCEQ